MCAKSGEKQQQQQSKKRREKVMRWPLNLPGEKKSKGEPVQEADS